jgi:hypothetical protein
LTEKIISRGAEEQMEKFGCKMISSIYTNGPYDWIISFSCKDLKAAKNVGELFVQRYSGHIERIELLEGIFPLKIQNILNPNIDDLDKILGI